MDIIIKNSKFYIGRIVYLIDTLYGSKNSNVEEYKITRIGMSQNDSIDTVTLLHIIPKECGYGNVIALYDKELERICLSSEEAKRRIKLGQKY